MLKLRDIPGLLALERPKVPPEILAAVFSASCESGLTTSEAMAVMAAVADAIDPAIATEIDAASVRLNYSVHRRLTYAALNDATDSQVLKRLLGALNSAELTGEQVVTRARQIFETLSAEREDLVSRRAETYPLIMIVFMVLFFLPAIVVLLVGPLYASVMQVLNSI